MNIYFIPVIFNDEDYRPSWTGNITYPTVTIRGIFDTYENALESICNWSYKDDCKILERYCGSENQTVEYFDIDYQNKYFNITEGNECSNYKLNELVDEEWSAAFDEGNAIGVTDW